MAGERKGIAYEAIVKVALDELVRTGKLKGKVFWNEKPAAMTIEPDFTVGPDENNPTHVFLVTHSGSAKDSEKKFWRNIGELAEAKVRLPKAARAYSIVFDSIIKEDLKALQAAAFDGQLLVGDSKHGLELLRWVDSNAGGLPKDRNDKVDAIRDAIKSNPTPSNPKRIVAALGQELATLIQTTRPALDGLWLMERKRPVGRAPAARDTFLRRGVGKLLLLDHPDDLDATGRLKRSVPSDVVESLKTMGLAADSIGGPRVTDPQMLWAVRSLSVGSLAELHKARSVDRMAEWIESLRTLAGVQDQLAYLSKHWSALTTGSGLYAHLKLCHRDPHKLCPSAVSTMSRRVWLYHLIVEWVKLADGTRTDFGVAAFIADLATLRSNSGHRRTVTQILGRPPDWRSEETIRLGLQDWQSAHSGQRFQFTDDDLARVADALARRLARTKKPDPKQDATPMTEALVQIVLEAKLLTYRNFKPFEVLLGTELRKAGLQGTLEVAVRACFAEAASAAGADLDPRSAGTTVMRVKNTLINWQSASDDGRDHKRKELCGRAPALRYSWDPAKNTFVKRPRTSKLILVADGTWRQDDLDALVRAGWDEVFYPDEMNRLVKAIV